MNLRARGPNGQATLTGVEPTTAVAEFQLLLESKLGVPINNQEILAGFPPKLLQLPSDAAATPLSDLGLADGDTLTVRRRVAAALAEQANGATAAAPAVPAGVNGAGAGGGGGGVAAELMGLDGMDEDEMLARAIAASMAEQGPPASPSLAAATVAAPAAQYERPRPTPATTSGAFVAASGAPTVSGGAAPTEVPLGSSGSVVARRVILSDNSCLFNAVGYVMEGSRTRYASQLRRIVADAVQGDPDTYSEAFLGKSPAKYVTWILDPKHWGGAIELFILSRHYQKEIAAFDIQTQRVDMYGQDAGYTDRAMLLYDGLHYDAMAQGAYTGAPDHLDVRLFKVGTPQAEAALEGARTLVKAAHQARQFTDTTNFTLRCGVCQIGVRGEKEAVEHAKATGHQNFSEYH